MDPFYSWAFFAALLFDLIVFASVVPYAICWVWGSFDRWRESRWNVVAEGDFKTITHGVRQYVHLEDGRSFLLILDHKELDLERGEPVRIRLGHCKRHTVERMPNAA